MTCEEFEAIGLGLDRERVGRNNLTAVDRAALGHANSCPRCAALQESWQDARIELRSLAAATQDVGAPLRVEMRLRQEFHTRHRTLKARTAAVMTAWALAGAVALIGAVSWHNWRLSHTAVPSQSASQSASSLGTKTASAGKVINEGGNSVGKKADDVTLIADNDAEDFTLLPGSLPQETGDASIVRVRMQRGALGALGLPVNEERAGEWIQVDLFVGQDGQPQAVRLPEN
jgi:anti-sigma factor RsiW